MFQLGLSGLIGYVRSVRVRLFKFDLCWYESNWANVYVWILRWNFRIGLGFGVGDFVQREKEREGKKLKERKRERGKASVAEWGQCL